VTAVGATVTDRPPHLGDHLPAAAPEHRAGERRRKVLLGCLVALATLVAPAVRACSCVRTTPAAVYGRDATVVLVRVVGLQRTPTDSWAATLVVLKSWKGPLRPHDTVEAGTMGPSGACGFFIAVGDQILVYADDLAPLSLGLCNTVRGDALPGFERALDRLSAADPRDHAAATGSARE
jgi:hypothetical protein